MILNGVFNFSNREKSVYGTGFIYFSMASHPPTDIYLFKVSNENTRTMCEICSNNNRHQNDTIEVVLVSLVLTLNRHHIMFWCFYY